MAEYKDKSNNKLSENRDWNLGKDKRNKSVPSFWHFGHFQWTFVTAC